MSGAGPGHHDGLVVLTLAGWAGVYYCITELTGVSCPLRIALSTGQQVWQQGRVGPGPVGSNVMLVITSNRVTQATVLCSSDRN